MLNRLPTAPPSWLWFAFVVAFALAFLHLNRYEVIACGTESCTVVDRLTGDIGYRITRPALAKMAQDDPSLDVDAFERRIAP